MLPSERGPGQMRPLPFNGGVVELPFPGRLDRDMHQMVEIGILLSGQEQRHIDEHVATLDPGDVWLCAAWEPHGWEATAPDTRELVVQFLPDILVGEMVDGLSYMTVFSVPAAQRPRVQTLEMRALALAIAEELRLEMSRRERGWLAAIRLAVMRLLLALSRHWHPPADRPALQYNVREGNLAKIMPALRLVQSHPARRLTVAEAGATCGLSASQFAHLFRTTMGLSFGRFSMRVRLAYAAQLLLNSDLPVETVAEEAGFSDASHLHHTFARIYGQTPARYRHELRDSGDVPGFMIIESASIEEGGSLRLVQPDPDSDAPG